MKTRQGFVSNSSSSSFIVGFAKKPETAEELRQLLYGEAQEVKGWRESYRTLDLATAVFRDMEHPATPMRILHVLNGAEHPWDQVNVPDAPEESNFIIENPEDPYNNVDWVAYGKAHAEAARRQVEASLGDACKEHGVDFRKLAWYEFHFSDEGGGFWSQLEHGNTFQNLPHICESHH